MTTDRLLQVRFTQPKLDQILDSKRGYPVFGSSLSSHLSNFHLPSGIAWPLQVCVSRLVNLGLEEEGLFRLAAGNGKVRRRRIIIMERDDSILALMVYLEHQHDNVPPVHHTFL